MPSPGTPRRTSNRADRKTAASKPKPIDVGNPLGPYDNNSVRERIRQWQSQGGGVITAADIFVEEEPDPRPTKREAAKKPQKLSPSKQHVESGDFDDQETRPHRSGRQRTTAEAAEKERHRSTTPKKRVVSDAHWRYRRSPPAGEGSSNIPKSAKAKKILPDDGIRVRAIPDDEIPENNSRWKNNHTHRKKDSYDYGDGIRIYPTPADSEKQHSRLHPSTEEGYQSRSGGSDSSATSDRSTSPTGRKLKSAETKEYAPEVSPRDATVKDSVDTWKSSRRKNFNPDQPSRTVRWSLPEKKVSAISPKGNILSHVFDGSKRLFSRPEPLPVATPRVPTIEAWLTETPDPFVDGVIVPDEIPVLVPSSVCSSRRERKVDEDIVIPEDPNKIWDTLDAKENTSGRIDSPNSHRRRRDRSSAFDVIGLTQEERTTGPSLNPTTHADTESRVDTDQNKSEPPTRQLQRRGAKRDSPSRKAERRTSSPLKESFTRSEDASIISSTASSVDPSEPLKPLKPPPLNVRRLFPTLGKHRLSTIASVETFNTNVQNNTPTSVSNSRPPLHSSDISFENDDMRSEARDRFDPNSLNRTKSKGRLAKHSDLISVLSMPRVSNKSIRSARSIRTNRSRLATATIGDLMAEFATDEGKYMRELRTMFDGVIPVLLNCVLSKSDSAIAAGLFRPNGNAKSDPNLTQPIIDMGITLEQLKRLHERVPQQEPDALLVWAQGARRVYADYLKFWRMGFQDVVVNLAFADETADSRSLDQGLPRNADGDVVNSSGERVDVAFLLKRPLVRLKYLAKTLKGINFVNPSAEAERLATAFQNLVIEARNRSNEERARLEDEAASNIDSTRARDPRTLGPLAGVVIDPSRRVRARDYFGLTLQHSSGQRIDCRTELLLRDNAPGGETGGDLLICEIDGTGRWLLLPPVQCDRVSARNGDSEGEIIVMVRGESTHGPDWQELLSLNCEDEQTGFEWVQMLGLTPVPPTIQRSQSFSNHPERRETLTAPPSQLVPNASSSVGKSRTPSPREIEIPIGEQANRNVRTWSASPAKESSLRSPASPPPRERVRLQKKRRESSTDLLVGIPQQATAPILHTGPERDSNTRVSASTRSPGPIDDNSELPPSPGAGLRPTKTERVSRCGNESLGSPRLARPSFRHDDLQRASTETFEPPKIPPQKPGLRKTEGQTRPSHHRSRSSVPSVELPIIPKVRGNNPKDPSTSESPQDVVWSTQSSENSVSLQSPTTLTKKRPVDPQFEPENPPPPPPHRTQSSVQLKDIQTPDFSPTTSKQDHRRPSSPLKHEYEPSTASESVSDSDASTVEHNDIASVSDSSEDEELEGGDTPTPLLPLGALKRQPRLSSQGSVYSLPNGTLGPSQSASQAPYKTVPSQPTKASKTIASIFFWSDSESWQSLHPDECSITISPGLIEAHEMSAAHSNFSKSRPDTHAAPDNRATQSRRSLSPASDPPLAQPLVALELTPLVPIRRGTAIDISIRSPPTAESKTKKTNTNNFLFRSRNPEECEALYALINHARINNPTYIALQHARVTSSFPQFVNNAFGQSHSTRGTTRSWFSFGGSGRRSYRARTAPTPSVAPSSDSSVASRMSAFSALHLFTRSGRFSIARSTVMSRDGSRANSVYTPSDHSSGSSTPNGTVTHGDEGKSAPIGLNNAKIRLYIRETASRWRDLGSARMTIMRPTNASHPPAPGVVTGLAAGSTGGQGGKGGGVNNKRILIVGKSKGETLLDVTLGETCFERVARTGIAVSVWEQFEGGLVAKEGGVVGGRLKVFMVQMKSEMETQFTFSIVGRSRF